MVPPAETAANRTDAMEDPCPVLSIVVCTHSRAGGVEDLLGILVPQVALRNIEIVVVDSASSPDHAERVRAAVESAPACRLERLDAPGVSMARNAGLAAARAPWIAYLDDDELPGSDWVAQALGLIARLPADCAACGGNIVPLYPDGDIRMLSPRWLAYLSAIKRAGEFDQSAAPQLPIGHSLVRAAAIREVGGFDPRLGRVNATLLSGEEVLLIEALRAAGWTLWHSDRIEVAHRIGVERLTRAWVIDRAFWEGVTTFRVLLIHDARKLWLRVIAIVLKWPILRLAAVLRPEGDDIDLRLAFASGYLKAWLDFIRKGRLGTVS